MDEQGAAGAAGKTSQPAGDPATDAGEGTMDIVAEASEGSFPASDPPSRGGAGLR